MFDLLISFLTTPLQYILNAINTGEQDLLNFFYSDIYPFITKTTAQWIKAAVIAEIKFKIYALGFAWDVVQELLLSLNISSLMNSAWGQLDSRLLQLLTFFRIPDGLNLLFSSYATRFVYRFLGF